MKRTAEDWYKVLIDCQVKPFSAAKWSVVFADTIKSGSFSKGDSELDDFLGQVLHESGGLEHMEEGLNYSAARLMRVWPARFPTEEAALPFAYNPEALANNVYGGRMGNDEPGDGWLYRGRSPIQITGKDNYRKVGNLLGQDLVGIPQLLSQPRFALEACIAWWEDAIPDRLLGDLEKVTRRVNGGLTGLAQREDLTYRAGKALA